MNRQARRVARTLRSVGKPDLASRLIEAFQLDDDFDVEVLGATETEAFDDAVELVLGDVDRFIPIEAYADDDDDAAA